MCALPTYLPTKVESNAKRFYHLQRQSAGTFPNGLKNDLS